MRQSPAWYLLALLAGAVARPAGAQVTAPVVEVTAARDREPDTVKSRPERRIGRAQMDRLQAATIFETVVGTPGVSLNGGPRASGTTFNIRGYGDTDDVLIKLDGAQKNFEKYRFGGTFIEPELLKGVAVSRGPDLLSGSGALGGTVSATTRDAADFLRPGERAGVRLKYATATVNREIARTAIGFARPRDDLDLLVAATRRTGSEYQIADGSRLPDSSVNQRSLLAKGTWFPTDEIALAWSTTTVDNRSREAYDATGGVPGAFGSVIRTVDDTTHTLNATYSNGGPWLDLAASIGRSSTAVTDLHRPGETLFSNAVTGNVNDAFTYDVTTVELRNTSRYGLGAVQGELVALVQNVRNARVVTRVTQNAAINASLYAGGFNPSQPSGTREAAGIVLVNTFRHGPVTVAPGLRWDRNQVTADGQARANVARFGQSFDITAQQWSGSLAATYRIGETPLLLGYRYVQAFKPPLVDEYFTQGAFSRCNAGNLGSLAPASGICGSLYRPERADTQEWSLTLPPIPASDRVAIDGRLAHFRNERRHLLLSLMPVGGAIGQPGWEHREGVEFEINATSPQWFGSASWAQIHGQVFDGRQYLDLYDAPGDTITLMLGLRLGADRFDVGFRYRNVGARSVVTGLASGNRPIVGRQEGHALLDLFLGFRPSHDVEFRIALDNALNEAYSLNNGFGGSIGSPAPGRNLRFSVYAQF